MHSDKIKIKKQPSYKLVKKNRQLAAFKKKGLNKSRSMENIHLNYYEDRKRSRERTEFGLEASHQVSVDEALIERLADAAMEDGEITVGDLEEMVSLISSSDHALLIKIF